MDYASFYNAMKSYIGLGRVETANDVLLTSMLSPTLFTRGPSESRLMQHLRAIKQELRPGEHVKINKRDSFLFKDERCWCAPCRTQDYTKEFHAQLFDKTMCKEWFDAFFRCYLATRYFQSLQQDETRWRSNVQN